MFLSPSWIEESKKVLDIQMHSSWESIDILCAIRLLTFQHQQERYSVLRYWIFSFWGLGLVSIGFMLEQKYVQDISRVYNISKWSYVQGVSKRSFYENELRAMTKFTVRNRGWKKR